MTSPPSPASRPCAAPSSGHIELAPSRGAACAVAAWLILLCGLILAGVELPLLARIATCVSIATPGIVAIRRVFLMQGPGCVRALSWSGAAPGFRLRLAQGVAEIPADLAHGSFRLGRDYLLLRLRTPQRMRIVFIDGNRQEVGSFRGLCRLLRWPPRVP